MIEEGYQGIAKFVFLGFIDYFGIDVERIKRMNNDPRFNRIVMGVVYAGYSSFGNKYLSNASELTKLLKEDYIVSMTPAMSSLQSLLDCPWKQLDDTGVFHKGNATNYIAFGTDFQSLN